MLKARVLAGAPNREDAVGEHLLNSLSAAPRPRPFGFSFALRLSLRVAQDVAQATH